MHGGGMGHGAAPGAEQAIDPVCGMTVDIATAMARNLHYRHEDVDYYFCGRGCRLDFEEDPGRYLDPNYQPSM
jgi:Cu+-exporting ATPase